MSADTTPQVFREIAKYLSEDNLRDAYTLLYLHLQDANHTGSTYYSIAERQFDKDRNLGPQRRVVSDPDTASFLDKKRETFEHFIQGKPEHVIYKEVKSTNPLLLLMMLDHMLKDEVELSSVLQKDIYTINGQAYYLLTRLHETNRHIKAAHQSGDLQLIVRWNHVVKASFNNHDIEVHSLDSGTRNALKALVDADSSIRIYSAESHRVSYDWSTDKHSRRFVFNGYTSNSTPAEIMQAMELANKQNAHIVIFPELSVNVKVRARIMTWLMEESHSLLLVIAGSWHVPAHNNSDELVNESVVFNMRGNKIFAHRKTTVFSFKSPGPDSQYYHEDIVTGKKLNMLMTPLGLTTLLICKDFCDLMSSLQEPLKNCSPDIIFLPTMGDDVTMNAHDKTYNDLNVSFMPALICSNQTPEMVQGNNNYAGRAYCGIHTIGLSNQQFITPDTVQIVASEETTKSQNDENSETAAGRKKKTAPYLSVPEDKLFALTLRK